MSDLALLRAASKQLDMALASGAAGLAFLGWWAAWKDQDGIERDDLIDLVKSRHLEVPS